ncbi:hypothetical protein EHS25_007270 [Saitozyma podzolica]|uniref:MARVEL domain-containing protein n=1 Tax=Saitozyma podzolica TaxID=1890683 RepID=A0A427XMQ8_9TREE|nr:hypothetical protein EHS25_007270 [Saitozyma podzolica]
MRSHFHDTRLTIQAFLFASLLIFGHILATSSAPLESVRPLSEINFLSLIWLAFTVIELADMGSSTLAPCRHALDQEDGQKTAIEGEAPQGCGPKSVLFLCRTEIELALGLVFTVAWGACWREAFLVLSNHTPGLSGKMAIMLSMSYFSILAGLLALSAQAFGSIMLHLGRNGLQALREGDVLGAKTGQWAVEGGIRLEDEEANGVAG